MKWDMMSIENQEKSQNVLWFPKVTVIGDDLGFRKREKPLRITINLPNMHN
jgi:hypothetical protein